VLEDHEVANPEVLHRFDQLVPHGGGTAGDDDVALDEVLVGEALEAVDRLRLLERGAGADPRERLL
jgi:hypothetical protein